MVQKSQTTTWNVKINLWKLRYFFHVNWCRVWSIISTIHPFLFVDFPPNLLNTYWRSVFGHVWGMIHWAQIAPKTQVFGCLGSKPWGNPKQKRTRWDRGCWGQELLRKQSASYQDIPLRGAYGSSAYGSSVPPNRLRPRWWWVWQRLLLVKVLNLVGIFRESDLNVSLWTVSPCSL